MKTLFQKMLIACGLLAIMGVATADSGTKAGLTLTPAEMKWEPSARIPGLETADIVGTGAGKNPGPYVYRVKYPANFKLQAHGHPDERTYVVLGGTIYVGWGKKFDETKLKALPPGSYWVEPANIVHFLMTKDESVVLHITGTGPTAVNYADPAHESKKK